MWKNKKLRMTPRFLASVNRRMEQSLTEMTIYFALGHLRELFPRGLGKRSVLDMLNLRCLLDSQKTEMSSKELETRVQEKSPGCTYKFRRHQHKGQDITWDHQESEYTDRSRPRARPWGTLSFRSQSGEEEPAKEAEKEEAVRKKYQETVVSCKPAEESA